MEANIAIIAIAILFAVIAIALSSQSGGRRNAGAFDWVRRNPNHEVDGQIKSIDPARMETVLEDGPFYQRRTAETVEAVSLIEQRRAITAQAGAGAMAAIAAAGGYTLPRATPPAPIAAPRPATEPTAPTPDEAKKAEAESKAGTDEKKEKIEAAQKAVDEAQVKFDSAKKVHNEAKGAAKTTAKSKMDEAKAELDAKKAELSAVKA